MKKKPKELLRRRGAEILSLPGWDRDVYFVGTKVGKLFDVVQVAARIFGKFFCEGILKRRGGHGFQVLPGAVATGLGLVGRRGIEGGPEGALRREGKGKSGAGVGKREKIPYFCPCRMPLRKLSRRILSHGRKRRRGCDYVKINHSGAWTNLPCFCTRNTRERWEASYSWGFARCCFSPFWGRCFTTPVGNRAKPSWPWP